MDTEFVLNGDLDSLNNETDLEVKDNQKPDRKSRSKEGNISKIHLEKFGNYPIEKVVIDFTKNAEES